MSYLNDPRVLFAAERTLLAWQRTTIAVIGFGLVVTHVSRGVCLVFLVAGAAAALLSTLQYTRILKALAEPEIPRGYMTWPGPALNILLAVTALTAAVAIIAG